MWWCFSGTIRRFLEKQQKTGVKGLDTIVLAVDSCDGKFVALRNWRCFVFFTSSPNPYLAAVNQNDYDSGILFDSIINWYPNEKWYLGLELTLITIDLAQSQVRSILD